MMMAVCVEVRRVLKPTGSAVFIIQPNSVHVGQMRGWVFEFMAWVCREWNMVQDAYWWNYTMPPNIHSSHGLLRPSVKPCVWCGPPDCYRDQTEILWEPSQSTKAADLGDRALKNKPSGVHVREGRCAETAMRRGGSTPYNLLPVPQCDSHGIGRAQGHPGTTALKVCDWWTRYICPPGGVVLDPFAGSGTVGLACEMQGRQFIGIERDEGYHAIASARIREAVDQTLPALDLGADAPVARQETLEAMI
jgi:hypothetical protein